MNEDGIEGIILLFAIASILLGVGLMYGTFGLGIAFFAMGAFIFVFILNKWSREKKP